MTAKFKLIFKTMLKIHLSFTNYNTISISFTAAQPGTNSGRVHRISLGSNSGETRIRSERARTIITIYIFNDYIIIKQNTVNQAHATRKTVKNQQKLLCL